MFAFRWFRRPQFLGLALVAFLASIVDGTGAFGQTWELGTKRFTTNAAVAAPPLRIRSAGRQDLGSYRFVGRVGGVSFEAIALPDASLVGQPIELSYDPAKPDGSRLVVRIGSQTLRASIPDWQLKPIVAFASSEYSAVVSL